jgi:hypothetical protein
MRAAGFGSADRLALVLGEDLMECAVHGHVEGAACELPPLLQDLTLTGNVFDSDFVRLNGEATFNVGPYATYAYANFYALRSAPPTTLGRYYLIRPRLKGDDSATPGQWELLLGTPLAADLSGGANPTQCRVIPIVPEATAAAAVAMAPSRDWCGTSKVSCAGTQFDDRLPLEDELTGDGDDIESSWKHYLGLARAAVDEADALGQEYIEASLRQELRTEEIEIRRDQQEEKALAAFQRVQEICGSAVRPDAVLKLLGSDSDGNLDLSGVTAVQCVANSSGPPVCGVRALVEVYPELAEVKACLGMFGTMKEVHLGDGSLCIAEDGTALPEGAARVRVVPDCQSCEASTGYRCLDKDSGLGLFDTKSLDGDPPLPDVCVGLQQLRASVVEGGADRRQDILNSVKENVALGRDQITGLPVRMVVNYDEDSGPHVRVEVGANWNVSSDKQDSELCANADVDCPTDLGGLFCKRWNCNDQARQGDLNLRLYRAGLALMNAVPDPKLPPRVDTVWYLNYYLQPMTAWGEKENQRQWRVFVRPERGSWGNTLIPVPQNVQAPVFLEQAWNEEGPAPELRILGTDEVPDMPPPSVWDMNRPMQVALRNAYLVQDPNRVAQGLRLDLLDRTGSEGTETGTVRMKPALFSLSDEDQVGLGVLAKKYSADTVANCLSCPRVADLNYKNFDGDLKAYVSTYTAGPSDTASGLLYALERDRGLKIFRPPNPPTATWSWLAPAAQIADVRTSTNTNTVYGVQVFPPPPASGITTELQLDAQAELDAIELVCRGSVGVGWDGNCGEPEPIRTVQDIPKIAGRLQCLGNVVKRRAATAVYELPEAAVEYLHNGERVYDATGGSLHIAISDLRNSLLQASLSTPIIGGTLERFGADMDALYARLQQDGIAAEINATQLAANVAQQGTQCFTSIPGRTAAAVATCVNAFAQIGFMEEVFSLQGKSLALESQAALAEFSGRASDYVTTISAESIRLSQALEGIQRNLDVIQGLKAEGLRAMQEAAWHRSTQASSQRGITDAIKSLKIGKGVRYRRAFDNAKKMAFFAKRAVEMRLGMSLADMVQDLPLVAAPATWEGSICQASGIDYLSLKGGPGVGEMFADGFLGNYVTKLEQVIESYRLVNNFHEGRDTVVVSLRDDIHNTRAQCSAESRNLLYWASDLTPVAFVRPGERPIGWKQSGCVTEIAEDEIGPFERVEDACISVHHADSTPFFNPITGVLPVPGFELGFGSPQWCGTSCAYQPGAAISQAVDLAPGRYRLSWYTTGGEGSGGTVSGRVRRTDGTEVSLVPDPEGGPARGFVEGLNGDWNRVYFEFDVFKDETLNVQFERPSATDTVVEVAAPLLEKLDDPQHVSTTRDPPPFADTTDERVSFLPVCEDTTGRNFRAENWHRHCQKLCPDGYSSNCAEQARTECYWETSFHVSQRSIEAGHMFNQSGFARGNYNYRLQSLGVNFVGTNLRACDGSTLPSACNAAGFIPYSVIHDGPYYVRNHKGQDYRAALFPGRIEHARGLGVERYISNPLGEADRSLIEPYMRSELMGRPLDGEFIIRVWDEDGVNFDAIEDVQLVIDYGYWTRFN